jgi:hypothetical protein
VQIRKFAQRDHKTAAKLAAVLFVICHLRFISTTIGSWSA